VKTRLDGISPFLLVPKPVTPSVSGWNDGGTAGRYFRAPASIEEVDVARSALHETPDDDALRQVGASIKRVFSLMGGVSVLIKQAGEGDGGETAAGLRKNPRRLEMFQ
jgi:hypothetical protein